MLLLDVASLLAARSTRWEVRLLRPGHSADHSRLRQADVRAMAVVLSTGDKGGGCCICAACAAVTSHGGARVIIRRQLRVGVLLRAHGGHHPIDATLIFWNNSGGYRRLARA